MTEHVLYTVAILDVDWMDSRTFASCSSDRTIYVCRVGQEKPLMKWSGHEVSKEREVLGELEFVLTQDV